MPSGACVRAAETTELDQELRLEARRREVHAAGVEPACPQDVVDDPAQPVRLVVDDREQALGVLLREPLAVPTERHRRAVHGRERRPQLVGHGRHELVLEVAEAALRGDVAEGVDGSFREAHARDQQPELAPADLERQRLGLGVAGREVRDRHGVLDLRPAANRLGGAAPGHLAGGEPRDRLGGLVPEPDDAEAVE